MLKIFINELGRIHDAIIDVKPMMVFTGDSGLGKSYTAFLINHVYNVVSMNRIKYFVQDRIRTFGKSIDRGFSFKMRDFRQWINNDTSQYIGYWTGNTNFKCDVSYVFDVEDDFVFTVSTEVNDNRVRIQFNNISKLYPEGFRNWEQMYCEGLNLILTRTLFGKNGILPITLPPARAAFMGAKNALMAFQGIGMYYNFIVFNDLITDTPQRKISDEQFFMSMMTKLTGGTIEVDNGQTYLRLSLQNRIPISAAASSVKEIASFLRLLQCRDNFESYTVLFEEPEAHVHPKNQDLVADLITRCFNRGMDFQITTHSDFILGRFNQLIRLGNLRRKNPEKFKQYCLDNRENENLYLNYEQIGAYYFKEKGDTVIIDEQDISNGIPFTTFHEIIDRQERVDDLIEQYLED